MVWPNAKCSQLLHLLCLVLLQADHATTTLNYKEMEGSMLNTPPCWSIYMCGLVFAHMLAQGGLAAQHQLNTDKAGVVYDAIAASQGFYHSPVDPAVQSLMNVPFTIPSNPDLEKEFIAGAAAEGMVWPRNAS